MPNLVNDEESTRIEINLENLPDESEAAKQSGSKLQPNSGKEGYNTMIQITSKPFIYIAESNRIEINLENELFFVAKTCIKKKSIC